MKKTIGQQAREDASNIVAEREATNILKNRHAEEYNAIFNKRLKISLEKWGGQYRKGRKGVKQCS